MLITPTAEHGPISWGESIYQPGDAFDAPEDKARKLINNGKAIEVALETIIMEPRVEEPIEEGEEEDADSVDTE